MQVMTVTDLHEINRLICRLNEIEDSKENQSPEKRIELQDRMMPVFRELYAKVGTILCPF